MSVGIKIKIIFNADSRIENGKRVEKPALHFRLRKGLESEMSQNWEMGVQYPAHCM